MAGILAIEVPVLPDALTLPGYSLPGELRAVALWGADRAVAVRWGHLFWQHWSVKDQ